ncbi:hypothetical protein EJ110_NYTH05967 [Nymphaea thermarum]|nr:hypothetical protein EJ110_NYTH05967 [Nymphaea thermarum]
MWVFSSTLVRSSPSLCLSNDSGVLYRHAANRPERTLHHRTLALALRPNRAESPQPEPPPSPLRLAASAILFLSVGVRACTACTLSNPTDKNVIGHLSPPSVTETRLDGDTVESHSDDVEITDEEMKSAFENWCSKTYALTVPLRVIALRGSMPPAWVKIVVHLSAQDSARSVEETLIARHKTHTPQEQRDWEYEITA